MLYMILSVITCILFCSCSFFQRNEASSELEKMTEDVLKSKEGINIIEVPINPPTKSCKSK